MDRAKKLDVDNNIHDKVCILAGCLHTWPLPVHAKYGELSRSGEEENFRKSEV